MFFTRRRSTNNAARRRGRISRAFGRDLITFATFRYERPRVSETVGNLRAHIPARNSRTGTDENFVAYSREYCRPIVRRTRPTDTSLNVALGVAVEPLSNISRRARPAVSFYRRVRRVYGAPKLDICSPVRGLISGTRLLLARELEHYIFPFWPAIETPLSNDHGFG